MAEQAASCIILSYGWRDILARQPRAFVDSTLRRVIPSLSIPDQEAFEIAEEARQTALEPGSSWQEEQEAEDYAQAVLRGFFDEQEFMQRQVREFAFATLFHVFERTLRKILIEANRIYKESVLKGDGDLASLDSMLGVLARCGYDTDGQPYRQSLHKLNLISNAVKHGHGRSLTQLAEKFPELFLHRAQDEALALEHLHYLTAELLIELAEAVAAFWESFPSQRFSVAPDATAASG
jgi:hypothetical protein